MENVAELVETKEIMELRKRIAELEQQVEQLERELAVAECRCEDLTRKLDGGAK